MNKKGYLFGPLFDMLIFLTLFVSVLILASNIGKHDDASDTVDKIVKTLEDVSKLEIGSYKIIQLEMTENSAIIGFNPGKDFEYVVDENILKQLTDFSNENGEDKIYDEWKSKNNFFLKGIYKPRPESRYCKEKSTCICYCKEYSFGTKSFSSTHPEEDAYIECEDLLCRSTDVKIVERMFMNNVFDDFDYSKNINLKDGPIEIDRSKDYWDNSFIIVRSDLINPFATVELEDPRSTHADAPITNPNAGTEFTKNYPLSYDYPIIYSGFRDFAPLSIVDVVVKKEGNGISICFKDKC